VALGLRKIGTTLAAVAVSGCALSACEANQIDWRNHFYAISNPACGSAAGAVHNGSGQAGYVHIDVLRTLYADFTDDGVLDVAVILGCTTGGSGHGSEIQIFTRDGAPVQRLVAPTSPGAGHWPSAYFVNSIGVSRGELVTPVADWVAGDAHCCPSGRTTYRWKWSGSSLYPTVDPASVY
jgi:hypothetical protein